MAFDHLGQYALSLPDDPVAVEIVDRHGLGDVVVQRHPSGRPWLIATPGVDPLLHASYGAKHIVVLGPCSASVDDLQALLAKAETADDLVHAVSRYHGSFIVFANVPEALVTRAPAIQTRRMFTAAVDGLHVVASRSDVLARLAGTDLDLEQVRLQLVLGLPTPHEDSSVWAGVSAVAGEQYARVSRDGTSMCLVPWWFRPDPTLTREDGAARLRNALEEAVAVRTAQDAVLVADLSGGLDSTPVCFFASQGPRGCVAKTVYADHPGGHEDLHWAKKALPAMPGVIEHHTYSVDTMPEFFAGLHVPVVPDEPTDASLIAPRQLHILRDDADLGASVHLTGNGGDHLFRGIPNWYQMIYRTQPRVAWKQIRSDQLFDRQRRHVLRRQLGDRTTYGAWYARAAQDGLTDRADHIPIPLIDDWSVPVEVTSLFTPGTRTAIGAQLASFANTATPLGNTPAEHFDLFHLRVAGKAARGMSQIGEAVGVRIDAPLLDDHVVEAVLSVSFAERDTPVEWKPLMKAAMKGLLPDDYLTRTTKTGGGAQAVRGYANNYPQLVQFWDEAGLFEHGWFDRNQFLDATSPSPTHEPSKFVYRITNVAMFLAAHRRLVSAHVAEGAA